MAHPWLLIDAIDPSQFFLCAQGDELRVGPDPDRPEAGFRRRLKRIRVELEFEGEPPLEISVLAEDGQVERHALSAGQEQKTSSVVLHSPPPLDDSRPAAGGVMRRLVVVDGADMGKVFSVNPAGVTRIGKEPKTSHVNLNDLYVAHVHCQLEVEGEHVFVAHVEGSGGTFINRQKISDRTEVHLGDVLRVGNSYLRLELGAVEKREKLGSSEKPGFKGSSGEMPVLKPGTGEMAALRDSAVQKLNVPAPEPTPFEKVLNLERQALGHFQIGPILGRGHSGVTFRALDSNTNQVVALKVLSADLPRNEAELQHFAKTMKPTLALRDSHVIAVHGVGKTGAYTWICREYVDGESLAQILAREADGGKRSWKRACRIGAHLAAGLDFLHGQGIGHGNLSPANVLIRADDGAAKIADVALTQALRGSHLLKEIAAKKRSVDAPYLAPEQLAGQGGDHRADLYALGALLYALVSGRPPYLGVSVDEILASIEDDRVVKPSKRNKDVPPAFEAVIIKLLSVDPEDRCQSAAEVLEGIEPIMTMLNLR